MKKFKLVVSAVLAVFLCITVAPAAFAMGANEKCRGADCYIF